MDTATLLEKLSAITTEIPGEIDILELRRSSIDELERRLRRMLKIGGEVCDANFERGSWSTLDDRTLVRLPQGALAVLYHASGAVKLTSGRGPMEALFTDIEAKSVHIERAESLLASLGLRETLLGRGETLTFERLWQTKAAGADPSGKTVDPVICRAIGAFRQHIEGIPVLGPASVAVQMAGGGALDGFSTLVRGPASEVLVRAKVLHPERAVRLIGQQLKERFGSNKGDVKLESRDGMRLGYLNLPKRKAQRVLAPVYLASIEVTHELESQAFVIAVPATERSYLALDVPGTESVVGQSSKLTARRCC